MPKYFCDIKKPNGATITFSFRAGMNYDQAREKGIELAQHPSNSGYPLDGVVMGIYPSRYPGQVDKIHVVAENMLSHLSRMDVMRNQMNYCHALMITQRNRLSVLWHMLRNFGLIEQGIYKYKGIANQYTAAGMHLVAMVHSGPHPEGEERITAEGIKHAISQHNALKSYYKWHYHWYIQAYYNELERIGKTKEIRDGNSV